MTEMELREEKHSEQVRQCRAEYLHMQLKFLNHAEALRKIHGLASEVIRLGRALKTPVPWEVEGIEIIAREALNKGKA